MTFTKDCYILVLTAISKMIWEEVHNKKCHAVHNSRFAESSVTWNAMIKICSSLAAYAKLLQILSLKRKDVNIMAEEKTLLDQWRGIAYNEHTDKNTLQKIWTDYFLKEKEIYQQLLANPDEEVKGTVKELAEKYNVDIMTMTGFLDGINESLKTANPIEEMDGNTVVSLGFEKELLYKNMVAAEADWLYDLEEWNDIFDADKKKALYKEQKSSTTIVKDVKIYPNDPCPCGSGKKYKKCCGKK